MSLRRAATVTACAFALVFSMSAAAFAQVPDVPVPDLPEAPELPAPVNDAVAQALGIVLPLVNQSGMAAEPAANAVGFGLRPGCSAAGTAIVAAALLGGTLPVPVSPGIILTPVFLACGAAFTPGPVDPVFESVDATAGPSAEDALQPVLDQAATAMSPVRPSLSEACTGASLFSSAPKQLPPPADRFDLIAVVCGG
jgi:hypothetical protein